MPSESGPEAWVRRPMWCREAGGPAHRWGPFEATVADPSPFHVRPAPAAQSGKTVMIDPRKFDDLARRIQASLPPGLDEVREDVTRNVRAIIAAGIARMDLVEREEFDVQSAVLARTREKLETLERRVRQLEEQLDGPGRGPEQER